ncbi:ankyrin repeat domain-containing protein [Streptomyces sp. MMBL 11-3]|uniref:ankyrin repeat domain-containing protein n=1 Tax=Streptomyces sp. MMBL 11-3 TaxID=3382639 RepID=UPI0039B502E9
MNERRRKKLSRRLVDAAALGDRARVEALLRSGAHAGAADSDGTMPLYAASVHGAVDTVRCLLAAGAPPDAESGRGTEGTPLCAAACWGHTETVGALLAHGADPELREDHGTGRSPLDWAMTGPYPETVALLIAAGARQREPADRPTDRPGRPGQPGRPHDPSRA